MGIRYRKSFGSKGVRVNLSKSGVGWSLGGNGVRVSKKASGGYRTSVGSNGVSYVNDFGTGKSRREKSSNKKSGCLTWIIIILCMFGFAGAMASCSPEEHEEVPEQEVVSEEVVSQEMKEQTVVEEIEPEFLDPFGGNESEESVVESEPPAQENQEPEPAQQQIVYRTETGEKYHRKGCRHLDKSCIEITLEEALNLGLDSCGVCY